MDWPPPILARGEGFDPGAIPARSMRQPALRALYALALPLVSARNCRARKVRLPDRVYAVGRGTELDLFVSRVGKRAGGARVLLQGAGEVLETEFWMSYGPRSIASIDFERPAGSPRGFVVGDLESLPFASGSIDIAASINVFEHLTDLGKVLAETKRVLTSRGCLAASFGPLYHTFGGDHFSDLRGGPENGMNHVLLDSETYAGFVEAMTVEGLDRVGGRFVAGRSYINRGLFSRLTLDQYREAISESFTIEFWRAYTDERAFAFRSTYPDKWRALIDKGHREHDLLISTVQVIARRR